MNYWMSCHDDIITDLEGDGVAACGGLGGGGGGAAPVAPADPRHARDGGRGSGRGLKADNLEVVPVGDGGSFDGVDGGDARAHGAHGGCLGGVEGGAPHPVGGLGGGGGDVGVIADGAVAPGPPDADVVVLVTQMSLTRVQGRGSHVPSKAGNGA